MSSTDMKVFRSNELKVFRSNELTNSDWINLAGSPMAIQMLHNTFYDA
jgi:hypothetical protein